MASPLVGHYTCLENSGRVSAKRRCVSCSRVLSGERSTRPNRSGPSHCRPSSGLSTFPQHSEDWLLRASWRASGYPRLEVRSQLLTCSPRVLLPAALSLGGLHGPTHRPLGKLRLHSSVSILSSLTLITCVRVWCRPRVLLGFFNSGFVGLPTNLRTLRATTLNHLFLPTALRLALRPHLLSSLSTLSSVTLCWLPSDFILLLSLSLLVSLFLC